MRSLSSKRSFFFGGAACQAPQGCSVWQCLLPYRWLYWWSVRKPTGGSATKTWDFAAAKTNGIAQYNVSVAGIRLERAQVHPRSFRAKDAKKERALAFAFLTPFNFLCDLCELRGLCVNPTRGIMGSLLAKHQRLYIVTGPQRN